MEVVPYTPEHREEMRAICLATASERARTDPKHTEFTLLMYCDPYLEYGTNFMLVDDDGVAHGYVLCCEDFDSWKPLFEPYAEKIRAISAEHAERVDGELAYFEEKKDLYPAHLHIDIEESYTGGGNGRKLIDTLLDTLRAHGVRGITFGAAPGNTRAAGFYEHMGFKQLTERKEGEGYSFGMTFGA